MNNVKNSKDLKKLFNKEIADLDHWQALPESTNNTQSFGYAHTQLYGRKRGNHIIGDIWYLNSETGEWSPQIVNINVEEEDKFGTLHFYKAVE